MALAFSLEDLTAYLVSVPADFIARLASANIIPVAFLNKSCVGTTAQTKREK